MKRDSFGTWAQRKRIGFGVLTTPSASPRIARCTEITIRNLLLHNHAGRFQFLLGEDVDSLIASGFVAGFDYLWLQASGHYLMDKPGIRNVLDEEMSRDFFFLGHILDYGESYFTIHHQCLFVNLLTWNELGRPSFGTASNDPALLHTPNRSPENFHDSHTPIWVSASGTYASYERRLPGWNFIHTGLSAGRRISPFPPEIRRKKTYLYPEKDADFFFKLGDLRRRANDWSNYLWPVNTEELEESAMQAFNGPVSKIIGVAAGLKVNYILKRFGFQKDTQVHYFDCSKSTLRFKKWLVENWDGCDFGSVIEKGLGEESVPALKREFVMQALNRFYEDFGGEEEFRRHWPEYRRLVHCYHCLDLFTSDCKKLVQLVDADSECNVLWWSNIFHSYYTHLVFSEEENFTLFKSLVMKLRKRSPNLFVIGKDHYYNSVTGRIKDLTLDKSPAITQNLYYPTEVLAWFSEEFDEMRALKVNGR